MYIHNTRGETVRSISVGSVRRFLVDRLFNLINCFFPLKNTHSVGNFICNPMASRVGISFHVDVE